MVILLVDFVDHVLDQADLEGLWVLILASNIFIKFLLLVNLLLAMSGLFSYRRGQFHHGLP